MKALGLVNGIVKSYDAFLLVSILLLIKLDANLDDNK
jgi:hypothetical protein